MLDTILKIAGGGTTGTAAAIAISYTLFTPHAQFAEHVAKSERGFILETVDRAREQPPGDYKDSLCKTLRESLAELCAAAPTDAICVDRATYLKQAGC